MPAPESEASALPTAVPVRAGSVAPASAAPPAAPTDPTFAELYRDAHADMVRLAYLLTGSAEASQDVVQDAFVSMHRTWARVREPRAYLRRAVVNGCTSHHRRRFRERARTPKPETHAELEADELFDVLASLPDRQRAAVVLRYWHDLDENQIADVLGCRPGTVGSLLHRAIARLREVLEP
jgi:RNA polymerase sigma-70 factor (sigma-E family)